MITIKTFKLIHLFSRLALVNFGSMMESACSATVSHPLRGDRTPWRAMLILKSLFPMCTLFSVVATPIHLYIKLDAAMHTMTRGTQKLPVVLQLKCEHHSPPDPVLLFRKSSAHSWRQSSHSWGVVASAVDTPTCAYTLPLR